MNHDWQKSYDVLVAARGWRVSPRRSRPHAWVCAPRLVEKTV